MASDNPGAVHSATATRQSRSNCLNSKTLAQLDHGRPDQIAGLIEGALARLNEPF